MAEFRRELAGRPLRAGAGVLLVALAVAAGCRNARQPGGNAEIHPTYNKDTGQLERITYDRNHDGKPDAWLVMNGARVVMAQLDENFDGTVDRWEYYADRAPTDPAPAAGMPALPHSVLERAEQATRGDGKVNSPRVVREGTAGAGRGRHLRQRPREQVGDLVGRRAAAARVSTRRARAVRTAA